MLCANNQQGVSVWATIVERDEGPFLCPMCQEFVILKKGRIKLPHFAHQPASDCSYAGQGESEEHREAKLEIYNALLKRPDVSDVFIERSLGVIRPDISFVYHNEQMAVEVQISTLSIADIERRTEAYARQHVAVLWTPPLPMEMFEYRYAPKDWERYLHTLYYGKVYYWSQDMQVQPVTFEAYMIPPSRYSNERRSKRFVVPVMSRSRTSILDLVPTWRSAWRSYPRAKLLMEPKLASLSQDTL